MKLLTKLRQFIATLHPYYKLRIKRDEWAKTIELPQCPYELDKYVKMLSFSCGHQTSHYLTQDEAREKLIKYGWIAPTRYKDCYYVPSHRYARDILTEWFKDPTNWKGCDRRLYMLFYHDKY